MKRIRIILADDHAVLRAGLKLLLQSEEGFDVVGEAADGEEALRLLADVPADVLIMDLSMPNMGGLECLREIRRRGLTVKILILTMFSEENYIKEAMQSGASGYVEKKALDTELFTAVRTVATGQIYLSQTGTQALLSHLLTGQDRNRTKDPFTALSSREREVLQLMVKGHSMSEVGAMLALSVKTVDTYKTRMMEKLGLSKKSELVNYAIRHGLLKQEENRL